MEKMGTIYSRVFLQNLSPTGKNELLKNAITMTCGVGEKVIAEGDGGKNLGLIIKGALEVRKENKVLAILGPGDTFGEMAFILNEPRSADVISAVPGTEVILMSLSSLNRLSKTEDKAKVWQNLARLLARRLMGRNGEHLIGNPVVGSNSSSRA
jgi:CRP-like cAMP-binding protein